MISFFLGYNAHRLSRKSHYIFLRILFATILVNTKLIQLVILSKNLYLSPYKD